MRSIGKSIRRKSRSAVRNFTKSIRQRSTSVINAGLMLTEISGTPICEKEERKPSLTNQKKLDTILLR